jgi:AraC-like DNA-binding protein
MTYQQIPPPAYLREIVRDFWTMDHDGDAPQSLGPLVDGCPGLIVQQPRGGALGGHPGKALPEAFLYGQTTRHIELSASGKVTLIGVRFAPDALKSLFGFHARELTDSCLDFRLLSAKNHVHLPEQLAETKTVQGQVDLLARHLFTQLQNERAQADPVTRYAVARMEESSGAIALKDLRDDLQLSERTFERRFERQIGIPPKLFSRVCRFQASLAQMRLRRYDSLSDVAFDNGYADQSHFIRTFQEFAGCSPQEFQKLSNHANP